MSALPSLQVPTLVLAGEQDRLAHVKDAQLLVSLIPNSGHLINYVQADLFHQYIRHFLA